MTSSVAEWYTDLLMGQAFATTGMTTLTIGIICIQLVSLIVMGMFAREFHRIAKKRYALLASIDEEQTQRKYYFPLVWVYVFLTLGITVATTYLFIFQPHLL